MEGLHDGDRQPSADQQEVSFIYTGEVPSNITQLLVDPSVRRIEDNAFENCHQLPSVTIPPAVQVIGAQAFMLCVSLTNVCLHEGLKCIGTAAFQSCTSLVEIELPIGITEIANSTFDRCKSLRTVSVPITVTKIGFQAFADCTSLVDMFLPNHLKRINDWAFMGCTALSSIELPGSLEFVGAKAFYNCKSLLSVEFPSIWNMQIPIGCFGRCLSLVNVSIPSPGNGCIVLGGGIPRNKEGCLQDRFSSHPVHSLCYNSALATRDQMIRILDDSSDNILDDSSLKDAFNMTPFHILASSASLNPEILECLLDRYPMNVLGYKDCFGNTMMDYLLKHTSPRAVPLLRMLLKLGVVNTVSTCNDLSMLVESIPLNSDTATRRQCVKDFVGLVGNCIRMELSSLLELSVWKMKTNEGRGKETSSIKVADDKDRDFYRYQGDGAGIVIQNVIEYLWEGEESISETAVSRFPLLVCSSMSEGR